MTNIFQALAIDEEKGNNISKQLESIELVRTIVEDENYEVDLLSAQKAIETIGKSKLEKDTKKETVSLLCRLLRREAEIKLTKKSYIPSIMPPLDYLKISAITALGKIGDISAISDLQYIYLKSKNGILQSEAEKAIKNLHGEVPPKSLPEETHKPLDKITTLKAKAKDKDPQFRKEAVLEFNQMKDGEALQLYLDFLTFEKDPGLREVAASELAKFIEERLIAKLKLVQEAGSEPTTQIQECLAVIRRTHGVESKEGAFDNAYIKLIKVGRPAIPSLVKVMKDKKEDIEVRALAAQIIGHIKDPDAITSLIEVLKKEDSERLRENASWALNTILRPAISAEDCEFYTLQKLYVSLITS